MYKVKFGGKKGKSIQLMESPDMVAIRTKGNVPSTSAQRTKIQSTAKSPGISVSSLGKLEVRHTSTSDASAMGINGGSNNSGINTAWGGGFNYNNIVGKKLDLQSNYFYNRFNPNTESHIQRQYLLPDTSYYNSNSTRQ